MALIAIGISSAYIVTSAILFIYPSILHQKKVLTNELLASSISSKNPKILRIGHRGTPRYAT